MHETIKQAVDADLAVLKATLGAHQQDGKYKSVVSLVASAFPDKDNPAAGRSFDDMYTELRQDVGDGVCNDIECYYAICDMVMWMVGNNAGYRKITLDESDTTPGQDVYKYLLSGESGEL